MTWCVRLVTSVFQLSKKKALVANDLIPDKASSFLYNHPSPSIKIELVSSHEDLKKRELSSSFFNFRFISTDSFTTEKKELAQKVIQSNRK